MENLPYVEEYNSFIRNYKTKEVSGEEVGEVIARLAQYFGEWNMKMVMAERQLFIISKDIESRSDDNGKNISSVKAQAIINATDEAYERDKAKCNLQNIEQFINALKALQKGVLNEYSHMGN